MQLARPPRKASSCLGFSVVWLSEKQSQPSYLVGYCFLPRSFLRRRIYVILNGIRKRRHRAMEESRARDLDPRRKMKPLTPAQLHFSCCPNSPSFPGHPLPGADGRAPLGRLLRLAGRRGLRQFCAAQGQPGRAGVVLRPWRWIIRQHPGVRSLSVDRSPGSAVAVLGPKLRLVRRALRRVLHPLRQARVPLCGLDAAPAHRRRHPAHQTPGHRRGSLAAAIAEWSCEAVAYNTQNRPYSGCTHRSIRAELHLSGQGGRAQPPVRRAHAHRAARPAVDAGAPL